MQLLLYFLIGIMAALGSLYHPPHRFSFDPEPESRYVTTRQLYVKMAFDSAIRKHTMMVINMTFENPTEAVFSKCGKPFFLKFPSVTSSHVLDYEAVEKFHKMFQAPCSTKRATNTIDVILQSTVEVNERMSFQATNRVPVDSQVTLHDITSRLITKVPFKLSANETNIWPIKIGYFLKEISKPNIHLKMLVSETAPVFFHFSKCGFKLTHFANHVDGSMIFDEKEIRFLNMLQMEKCGKPWMDDIIELHLTAGNKNTTGLIEFDVIDQNSFFWFAIFGLSCFVLLSSIGSVLFVLVNHLNSRIKK